MATRFFNEDRPHGLMKRIMLKKYLQGFIASTLHTGRKVLYIDGFAGRGTYGTDERPERDTPIEMFGSPLIALKVAFEHFDNCRAHRNNCREYRNNSTPLIYLYFVEKKKKIFNELVNNIKNTLKDHCAENGFKDTKPSREYTFRTGALYGKVVNGDFKNFDPPAEMSVKDVRCITFLDPFGYTDTPMEVVKKFLGATNQSLIINFMSDNIVSFGGKTKVTMEHVNKLYGIDILTQWAMKKYEKHNELIYLFFSHFDWVMGNVMTSNETEHIALKDAQVKKITEIYEKILRRMTKSEFAVTFGMRREKEDSLIYHIVFVTSELQCLVLMKEAMNRASNYPDQLEMGNYDLVVGGVVFNLANFQNEDELTDKIYNEFKGRQNVPITIIKKFVLSKTPFVFREKQLKTMQMEEEPRIIEVLDQNGRPQRRRGTFPKRKRWFITFSDRTSEDAPRTPQRRCIGKTRYAPYPVSHNSHSAVDIRNTTNQILLQIYDLLTHIDDF